MSNDEIKAQAQELERLLKGKVNSPVKVGWLKSTAGVEFIVFLDSVLADLRQIPDKWYGNPVSVQGPLVDPWAYLKGQQLEQ